MGCDGSAGSSRTQDGHFLEGLPLDFDTSPYEGQEEMSAKFFRRPDFQESVQELPEAIVVDFLEQENKNLEYSQDFSKLLSRSLHVFVEANIVKCFPFAGWLIKDGKLGSS